VGTRLGRLKEGNLSWRGKTREEGVGCKGREEKGCRRKKEEAMSAPRRMNRKRCSLKRYDTAERGKVAALVARLCLYLFIMVGEEERTEERNEGREMER
jgi:hypothetical protein